MKNLTPGKGSVLAFAFLMLFMNTLFGYTQNNVSITKSSTTISQVFKEIKKQTGLTVFYSNTLLNDKEEVKVNFVKASLEEVMNYLLKGKNVSWNIKDQYIVIQKNQPRTTTTVEEAEQRENITGTVTDEKGVSLPGVNVKVKGTNTVAITDANGRFSIVVPNTSSVLVFTYIGFSTLERTVGNQKTLKITLKETSTGLNEVVVVGYGTVRKRDLTGSVASVKGAEIAEVPSASIIESIQGKVPGVDITRSSGSASSGVNITVRGNRSISATNGPLFIVDGVQYSEIQDINPNDIESMDILKDASSTAIYGSRGANGVIIITTKKGTTGKATVSFNPYAGISQVARYPNVMNMEQWTALRREAYRTNGVTDDTKAFNSAELTAIANNQFLNYQDLLIHNGTQQDYQLGVNAGTENTKVYFSLDYLREKGIFKQDWSNRYAGRLNIDQKIGKFFKAGMQAQLTRYEQSIRRDPLNQANKINPLGTVYDDQGNFIVYPLSGSAVSPLADEQPDVYTNRNLLTRVLTNAFIEVNPAKGLTARSTLGSTILNNRGGTYASRTSIDRNGSAPLATYTAGNGFLINLENVVNYQKTINKHSLTLTGVNSFLWNRADTIRAQGENQLSKSQLFYALENATQNIGVNTDYGMSNLVSFAGRVNYSFDGKYLFTFTGRTDGSSILAKGNKWAFFPSAAFAWRVKDEPFLKNVSAIDDLKLRVSYGKAGNYSVLPYSTTSTLVKVAFGWDEASAPGYTVNRRVGNDQLGWEITATTNLGLDISVLKNKLSATLDYYDSKTSDLLLPRGLPPSTGVNQVIQNIGKTRNRGIELSATSNNIKKTNFSWTSTLSFTRNKEEITELFSGVTADIGNGWFVGSPIRVFYDYEKLGIWQLGEETEAAKFGQKPGDIKVRDLNNDGKIDDTNDRTIVGSQRPRWFGGLDNSIKYKNFDFNVYIFARIGQMIDPDFLRRYDPQGLGQSSGIINYWTPENPSNLYPRPNSGLSLASMRFSSTIGYVDGSFLRVRNLSLGYTLPKSLFNKSFVNNFRVYATGKNLFTWTKSDRLKDYDPERGGSENFPMTKLYVFGINATF
ncbi:TonB-dependent receptor [Desertivirga brevis]|uniref:TonB-dependent receptor n=1 Tax=Desertivirga brevis TaxID=2810310 RepID=UPI001F617A86|nr:TonB-dependent receptor [Pedobacter sp. SYSU D00873]